MSAIKPGDLVMIVKLTACCGKGKLGHTFTAGELRMMISACPHCGHFDNSILVAHPSRPDRVGVLLSRLKKIDPPETGDSLPTRADLNIPEPACP